jgi:hypothetical protein
VRVTSLICRTASSFVMSAIGGLRSVFGRTEWFAVSLFGEYRGTRGAATPIIGFYPSISGYVRL